VRDPLVGRRHGEAEGGDKGEHAVTNLIVDNSILASVATCSTQGALRYALGYAARDEAAYLRAGTAVHAALGAYLATQGDETAALAALAADYQTWAGANVPDTDRLSYHNVRRIVSEWMRTHPIRGLPFVIVGPEWVERPFQVPLAPGIDFVGRMDGIASDPAGVEWIVEIKTTGRMDDRWRRRWRMASQLTGYTWAGEMERGRPVAGVYVVGIEMAKLPDDPKRKCKTHGVAYIECGALHANHETLIEPRAPHQIRQWHRAAVGLAQRYVALTVAVKRPEDVRAVTMEGQFTGACGECFARDWCAVGRGAQYVESLFEHRPWNPLAHAGVGPEATA
jgi:hypothetical protein